MKSLNTMMALVVLSIIFFSCTSRGLYSGYLGPNYYPSMIQPLQQDINVDDLPHQPNFVHSYHNYKKSKTDSQFGALVRILEFEYDISDSLFIIPRFTSGFDEGQMTGVVKILLDQYELTYEDSNPEIREYVEEVSYEIPKSHHQSKQIYAPNSPNAAVRQAVLPSTVLTPSSTSIIRNELQDEKRKVVRRSQIYNRARIALERDDVQLLIRTNSLSYVVYLDHAVLNVYPTKDQIRALKRMIQKYYKK